MRAIDQGANYDVADGLVDLSILGESFLNDLEMPALDDLTNPGKLLPPNESRTAPLQSSQKTVPNGHSDSDLWQSLLLEQKKHYEETIRKLRNEVIVAKSQGGGKEEEKKDLFERERWKRFSRVLSDYFAEYNVQI